MNFNLHLDRYKKRDGTQSVRLKLSTSNNDTQYISTIVSVKPNQWDKVKQFIKQHTLEENLSLESS